MLWKEVEAQTPRLLRTIDNDVEITQSNIEMSFDNPFF